MRKKRIHRRGLSKEIGAIIRGGLTPRLVLLPDDSIELTGLPPNSVGGLTEADDLGRRIDAMGVAVGDGE